MYCIALLSCAGVGVGVEDRIAVFYGAENKQQVSLIDDSIMLTLHLIKVMESYKA